MDHIKPEVGMDEKLFTENIDENLDSGLESIAIIGMSGRFPGAENIETFWENIRDGEESISFYSEEELREAGLSESLLRNPNFVKASATIKDAEMFDAAFFGFTPREAMLMDPQHRVFLESSWHALENAGIDTRRCEDVIGVFAGTNPDNYLLTYFNEKEFSTASPYEKRLGSDSGFLATRVAYKLNLKGPAITIQTACSTSLVTIATACQHLMTYQCDVALAGASTVQAPRKSGYLYQQHGIGSPDGHCRVFDVKAQGTIGGEGVATVVLKRLDDALECGDTVHAVIKGWALNNDGDAKVGFTAPSVDGQAEVVEMAQALAGVSAGSIGYLEAHGTGTELGDPIEVAALTQAFSATTDNRNYCALGSVKANIGHLDAVSGIAGFIKAVLVLKHKQIPPLVHYQTPNPKINLEMSPFYINAQLQPWEIHNSPRRAGISSFGMGGTNVHMVLEESPDTPVAQSSRTYQLLLISARNEAHCDQAMNNLAEWIENHPEQSLADIAYTLQTGRRQFSSTASCVVESRSDAVIALRQGERASKGKLSSDAAEIAFMFPGQGNQYLLMGFDLYQTEPVFREIVDTCSDSLKVEFDYDLSEILYPSKFQDKTAAAEKLERTEYAQPALFVIEYAMAKLLMSWGIQPKAFIGHSIGEYVAATLAGVFTLDAALKLVAYRGRLMQSAATGSMAAIPLSEEKLRERLPDDLSIGVINEPNMCVVSGDSTRVKHFIESCEKENMHCHLLHTSHAFHSVMMEGILDDFSRVAATVNFSAPEIPFLSNVTGDWITQEQATDASYWVSHIRHAVLFNDGIVTLLKQPSRRLYEVGPGNSLSSVAKRHPGRSSRQLVITTMRHPREVRNDVEVLLESIGHTWCSGVAINWSAFYENENRLKVPLPGYPFERKRYWIDLKGATASQPVGSKSRVYKNNNIGQWAYIPVWQSSVMHLLDETLDMSGRWLIFANNSASCKAIISYLEQRNAEVISITVADDYTRLSEAQYTLNPACKEDFECFFEDEHIRLLPSNRIIHCWGVSEEISTNIIENSSISSSAIENGFYSLLFLVQAMQSIGSELSVHINVLTQFSHSVTGNEIVIPEKSMPTALLKVLSQEIAGLSYSISDVIEEEISTRIKQLGISSELPETLKSILSVFFSQNSNQIDAYRGNRRWVQTYNSIDFPNLEGDRLPLRLRKHGIYLITGGVGGVGLSIAYYLAKKVQATLVLTARTMVPEKDEWSHYLETHDREDKISTIIRQLIQIESSGGIVFVESVDVCDSQAMHELVNQVKSRYGNINAVIHAAGVVSGTSMSALQSLSYDDCELQFAAKVYGLEVLKKLFENDSLDFFMPVSSLSTVLGGLGFAAYSAANQYMDSVCQQQHNKDKTHWMSVNWDGWQFEDEDTIPPPDETSSHVLVLSASEGQEVFERALNLPGLPQLVISAGDLDARLKQWVLLDRKDLANDKLSEESSYGRPDLNTGFVEANTESQKMMAEIWVKMFNINKIGIYDNFFELGGHSLLAVQILARINDTIGVQLSLNDFFDAENIYELALLIDRIDASQTEVDSFENTDDMVDALSDEEVSRLLAEKGVNLDE